MSDLLKRSVLENLDCDCMVPEAQITWGLGHAGAWSGATGELPGWLVGK
jgi:hypothetical protein